MCVYNIVFSKVITWKRIEGKSFSVQDTVSIGVVNVRLPELNIEDLIVDRTINHQLTFVQSFTVLRCNMISNLSTWT